MKKCFFYLNRQTKVGDFSIRSHFFQYIFILNNDGFTRNPQSFSFSGNEKKQSYCWIFQYIYKCIRPAIAKSIRNNQSIIVEHMDKA